MLMFLKLLERKRDLESRPKSHPLNITEQYFDCIESTNIQTYKHDNPLWLITFCCGTAIEQLSSFTEFYLKPLSQSPPSFVKDSTDFINKLEDLHSKGPFHEGSLLMSWDVVSMFPNIDNNLGISAVRRAFNSRSVNIPSTDCLVEAVEICLRVNNCQFSGQNFVQKHGTVMGPKNACSYLDLAMGVVDEQAKFEGSLKLQRDYPNTWSFMIPTTRDRAWLSHEARAVRHQRPWQASNKTHELNQLGLSVYDHVTETYALVEIQGWYLWHLDSRFTLTIVIYWLY